jgi:membrane-bound lytic murein transglycosylase MltF
LKSPERPRFYRFAFSLIGRTHVIDRTPGPIGNLSNLSVRSDTASEKEIGIAGVAGSADANIHAGAKYLRFLATRYIADPAVSDQNKVLMALAAYNAGPGSLKRFRAYATEHGLDPNVWFGNVESAAAAIKSYETVQYVSNIYKYYIVYSLLGKGGKPQTTETEASNVKR